jgi:hypothetical protein
MTELQQGYLTPLRVENYDDKNWTILEDFCWRGVRGDVFTVHAGERTDFATSPWWSQAILPRTGTWTKAAVLHDKMCNQQNEFHAMVKRRIRDGVSKEEIAIFKKNNAPTFTSIDTDNIFYLNARNDGTDRIRSELLWFGVRCGALSPPRRGEWWKTFPRWFADLIVILAILVGIVVLISWAWPW